MLKNIEVTRENSEKAKVTEYAFSLIELMVVIAVILILAGFLMPSLSKSKAKAVRSKLLNNVRSIHMANIQYRTAYDEMFLINTLSGGTVGINYEPLKEHGFSDELSEDYFRLNTLANDTDLQAMSLDLDLNSFHASGKGLLYFNFASGCPSSDVISRDTIRNKFGYDIPDDTNYMIIGVGLNGQYDTFRPVGDSVYLSRESNANIEQWPGGR